MPLAPNPRKKSLAAILVAALTLFALVLFPKFYSKVWADPTLDIYQDSLSSGWSNWSWGSSVNFSANDVVYSGSSSISFSPSSWGALYFHNDTAINPSGFKDLSFQIRPSAIGQKFAVIAYDGNNQQTKNALPLDNYGGQPQPNTWTGYTIPMTDLASVATQIKGFAIQEISGSSQQNIHVDQIAVSGIVIASSPSPSPSLLPSPSPQPDPQLTPTLTTVYQDTLSPNWVNWSWSSNINFSNTNPVFAGSNSISYTPTGGWAGMYLHSDIGVNTSSYNYLSFAARGSGSNQSFSILAYDSNNNQLASAKSLQNYGGISTSWKIYNIPLADLNASVKTVKGLAIQETSGKTQPTLYIDSIVFSSSPISPQPAPQPTPTPTTIISPSPVPTSPAPSPTPSPQPDSQPVPTLTGFSTSNGNIYQNGSPIKLKGISWFGFETGTHVVHGLWTRNWKDMISQMKNLGFNSVRVPVCPATLQGSSVDSIDYWKNPDLKNLNSLQILDKVLTELNNQQMYFLLDHHTTDCQTISPLWYTGSYSESQWISDLKLMAGKYKNLPYFFGIDIKNEPHGNATWGTGNTSTDWNLAAERAGKAVLSTNPNLLIFVQGIQENPVCSSNIAHWMGGNLEPQNCAPISTSAIPANKLVLSPHVYGPDVYYQGYFADSSFPNNMPAIWDKHFGSLVSKGLTIVPGEWGGRFGTLGNMLDYTLQNSLVSYFKSKGVCNSYWWSWNPNSGDTGGILQDDWTSVWSSKVQMLTSYFNACS